MSNPFSIGDLVTYNDANLVYVGTVTHVDGSFAYVHWDKGYHRPIKEWAPNLKKVKKVSRGYAC